MSYSIYDKFLTITDCKFYCNQISKRLELSTFDYFFDKYNQIKFSGDSNLRTFDTFKGYEDWRLKFNLTKPATIRKTGLDEYVLKNKELVFNLTIKGFSFIYVCKFSVPSHNETEVLCGVIEPYNNTVYIEDTETKQLRMIL